MKSAPSQPSWVEICTVAGPSSVVGVRVLRRPVHHGIAGHPMYGLGTMARRRAAGDVADENLVRAVDVAGPGH